ncbi:acid phosphatase [Rhodococcoides fascians]|uniref:acid phosphatase n=1 Tax=Rhodococcoides fascians TaxID=1828 RepID=UPI00211AB636|nr:acid phosphatase [Rhodococcus fascians]
MTNHGAVEAGRVVLLRHGETEWALAGKHTGNTDVPLTAHGEQQAVEAGSLLTLLNLRDPVVISSPRERARRTADLAGLEVDRTWDALSEWDYGDYEGITSSEIHETVPHWTVWTHPCPGGESIGDIAVRVELVLSVVLPLLEGRDVVLVGHGHFSRALIAGWTEASITEGKRFALSPAAYSLLGFEHSFRQLMAHNVHPSILSAATDRSIGTDPTGGPR